MNRDLANFSTDLRRISDWIMAGDYEMARKFIRICKTKYSSVSKSIACYENIWDELKKVEKMKEKRIEAADRASTISVILINEALH